MFKNFGNDVFYLDWSELAWKALSATYFRVKAMNEDLELYKTS